MSASCCWPAPWSSIGLADLGPDRQPDRRRRGVAGLFGILWAIDTLASLLPQPIENWLLGLSLLAHFTPFATGAMYTVRFRLLPRRHPARPVPDGPRAGAALSDGRASDRASTAALGGGLAGRGSRAVLGGTAPAAADAARAMAELALHRRRASSPGSALWALANVALTLNDGHIDLTREKVYTPSAAAMAVVDGLGREVRITYFYHSQDPAGRRARDILAADAAAQSAVPAHRGRSRQGARRWRAPTASASTTPRSSRPTAGA